MKYVAYTPVDLDLADSRVWAKSRAKWVSFSLAVGLLRYTPLLAPIGLHLWPLVRWVKVISWLESKKNYIYIYNIYIYITYILILSSLPPPLSRWLFLTFCLGEKELFFHSHEEKGNVGWERNVDLGWFKFNFASPPECAHFTWSILHILHSDRLECLVSSTEKCKNSTWKVSRVHTTFSFLIFSQQFCFSCPCKFTHSSIRISIFLH